MVADRVHLVDTVVRPALAAGQIVVTDRLAAITIAGLAANEGLDAWRGESCDDECD